MLITQRHFALLWARHVLRPALPSRRPGLRHLGEQVWDFFRPARSFAYWSRHPLLWLWVRRRVRWTLEGRGYLDA